MTSASPRSLVDERLPGIRPQLEDVLESELSAAPRRNGMVHVLGKHLPFFFREGFSLRAAPEAHARVAAHETWAHGADRPARAYTESSDLTLADKVSKILGLGQSASPQMSSGFGSYQY